MFEPRRVILEGLRFRRNTQTRPNYTKGKAFSGLEDAQGVEASLKYPKTP